MFDDARGIVYDTWWIVNFTSCWFCTSPNHKTSFSPYKFCPAPITASITISAIKLTLPQGILFLHTEFIQPLSQPLSQKSKEMVPGALLLRQPVLILTLILSNKYPETWTQYVQLSNSVPFFEFRSPESLRHSAVQSATSVSR